MPSLGEEIPSPFTNRFNVVLLAGGLVRISFCEQLEKDGIAHPRTAATITARDAEELSATIARLLAQARVTASGIADSPKKPQ